MRALFIVGVLSSIGVIILLSPCAAVAQEVPGGPPTPSEMHDAGEAINPSQASGGPRQPRSYVLPGGHGQSGSRAAVGVASILLFVVFGLLFLLQVAITVFVLWCLWSIKVHTQKTAEHTAALSERMTPQP